MRVALLNTKIVYIIEFCPRNLCKFVLRNTQNVETVDTQSGFLNLCEVSFFESNMKCLGFKQIFTQIEQAPMH